MFKKYILLLVLLILLSCKEEANINNDIYWKIPLNEKSMIYDPGIGYPIYNNTVVFHSTPQPWGNIRESVLHGLDTKTGMEKWRLTNKDFYPKKSLEFAATGYYYYQYNNIFVGADYYFNDSNKEKYLYAFDIEKGEVLWIKPITSDCVQFGAMVIGKNKTAYVDFMKDTTEFSLIKIDIETGNYSEVFKFTKSDIPQNMPEKSVMFHQMSQIYIDNNNNEYVAFSFNGYNYNKDRYKAYMTLCVYNLTQNKIAYSTYVNTQTLGTDEYDDFYGGVTFHNGKLFVGKGKRFFCFDAYENKGVLWQYKTGIYGTDNAMQVFGYDNLALGYTLDRLFVFNINTGSRIYDVAVGGSSSSNIIDGIIYQREGSDLTMRDPHTGRELKRIATGLNEQAFSSSRPNGKDGKIYLHSYTDAYCIKAWGK